MGISISEFRVSMETYGAKRLPDQIGSRYNILVPCFAVGDVEFLHSGSYYVIQCRNKAPEEIMNKAMAEFGEKHPGKDNFWYGEIHSVKGILTLAAMLDGKYSKKFVKKLTNTTYKKLLECSLIQTNVEIPFHSNHSPKMEELRKKLAEYSSIVNPFGDDTANLKEPIEYTDLIKPSIEYKEGEKPYARLTLIGRLSYTEYYNDSNGWYYDSSIDIQRDRKNGYISMSHYYTNGNNCKPIDEVVCLDYKAIKDSYDSHPKDIDLRISLKTGFAWQTYMKSQAAPATDKQIDIMITHLNTSIKKIKQRMVRYMIKKA